MRLFCAAFVLLLSGCETPSGARMGLFSASSPIIALMEDDLLYGLATGHIDRSGTIQAGSRIYVDITCIGSYHYTSMRVGEGKVTCSDGRVAVFQFFALGALTGYGYGNSTNGVFSFTYGMTAEDSIPYLRPPKDKRVEKVGDELTVVKPREI